MSLLRRVVLDTSTLVGAALKPGSVPHRALLLALARADVCASVQTWLELERVMQHPRFDRYLARGVRLEFAAALRQSMQFFAVTPADEAALQPPCRDASDHKFLALVQVCQADALVSSDDDLRVLNPWRGVPVLRPAEFLARVGAA
ncbi:MAG TPA: putative toxin-antitoxin system toxin component, PIN family [Rubrivivax sp.]|nr:putative toxin-antitoxin system toxin component, PIN family [Rubrivivax sp.]